MLLLVASRAQGNEIRVSIRVLPTARLFVMDLQIVSRAADLTLPPVPIHYLLAELFVRVEI